MEYATPVNMDSNCHYWSMSISVGSIACLQEERELWNFATPISILYSPYEPMPLASEATAALRPICIKAVTDISPALVTNWAKSVYAGCMVYVRCTHDKTVPIEFQDMMVSKSGGKWKIVTMEPVTALSSVTQQRWLKSLYLVQQPLHLEHTHATLSDVHTR